MPEETLKDVQSQVQSPGLNLLKKLTAERQHFLPAHPGNKISKITITATTVHIFELLLGAGLLLSPSQTTSPLILTTTFSGMFYLPSVKVLENKAVGLGLPGSRHQDRIRHTREFLGETSEKDKGERSTSMQESLQP